MTANPVDLIGGLATTANVVKADISAWAKARVPQVMANATEIRNTTLASQIVVFLKSLDRFYFLDTSDTTTADDGITCIISGDGFRFKSGPSIIHLVVYTVAPSTASAADKMLADFVGDGVNDQIAVAAAIAAAGNSNSMVEMLPGVFTFSAALTISNANNFVFHAEGTIVFGPGGSSDTFIINGALNGSRFRFGAILNSSTGAQIHVKAAASAVNNAFISWSMLKGTSGSHVGKGLFLDATAGGMTVNSCEGGWISGFDKGVVMDATGTTNFIDTTHVKALFIFDCNTDIYGRSGTGTKNNSNIWDVNVDPYINGAVAVDIDHITDRFDPIIWGDQAPNIATTFLLKLQPGAAGNQFNGTPNIITAFGTSLISDASGSTTNTINGSSIDATINGLGQLVKYNAASNGQLDRVANVNNAVLVTSGGGVPLLSATLPSGIAATSMALTTPVIQTASPNFAGGIGYGAGTLNYGDGAANHTIVSTDQSQTLTNKTLTTPVINGLPTGTGVATANTASTLVSRDASGNFAAGAITPTSIINAVGAAGTPSYTFSSNAGDGMFHAVASTVSFSANGLESLRVATVASAVNYAKIIGSATSGGAGASGNRVSFGAEGSDAVIPIDITAKGVGTVNINGYGSNAGGIARFSPAPTSAASNGFFLTAANSGGAPQLTVNDLSGTGNANIDFIIGPKGTGVLMFQNAGSVTANGAVGTTMTSLGPTGSHTTVQEWLTIKNPSGTVRYIPLY